MSKTVDELCDVFGQASGAEYERWLLRGRGVPNPSMHMRRAGIRAVIAVLRDDLCDKVDQFDLDGRELANEFNGILASEGGQAAGAERVETLTSAVAQAETPAAPAPVCVWVDVGDKYKSACGRSHFAWTSVNGVVACPGCKNPIEWEAQR